MKSRSTILSVLFILLAAIPVQAAATGKIVYSANVYDPGSGSPYQQIFIINPDGTDMKQITTDASLHSEPVLSPDGSRIAFLAGPNNVGGIYLMNADGTGREALIPNTEGFYAPAWSHDGSKLAAINPPYGATVVTFNPDGSGLRTLTSADNDGPRPASVLTWSPDGSRIAFDGETFALRGLYQIYVVNTDGASAATRLSRDDNTDYATPAWSPDGTKIACEHSGIITLNPTTGAETPVIPPPDPNDSYTNPTWSPDGTKLAFISTGDSQVTIANSNGSNLDELPTGPAFNPNWNGVASPNPTPTPKPSPSPTPPPHGGLSPTTFGVDGSSDPTPNVADTVLSFSASQSGRPAGLSVRVQSSTTPNLASSWTNLPDGNSGTMTYDPSLQLFITATLNYPTVNGLYFRAKASAQGYTPDSISNNVGPFNLASSKPRLSPPVLAVTGNGPFADLYFRSYVAMPRSGMALRVQNSTTPDDQTSWTDLNDGKKGHMLPSNATSRFYLMDNKLPEATGVYYRIIASLTGYADALSTPFGPLKLTLDTPPAVTVTAPKAISGNGTEASPYVYNLGKLGFVAKATMPAGGGKVAGVGMTADGELFAVSLTSTLSASYTPAVIGDHLIEVIAVDSKGGISRFGTSPIYIRVLPSTTGNGEREEMASGSSDTTKDAAIASKVFTAFQFGGLWSDPTTWRDAQGKNGVPGPNDLAVIPILKVVNLSAPAEVGSVALSGSIGNKSGDSTVDLTIDHNITMHQTALILGIHLIIGTNATCEAMNGYGNASRGSITNYGTFNLHGSGGFSGLSSFDNYGSSNFQFPVTLVSGAGQNPTADNRIIAADVVHSAGVIGSPLVSTPIGKDGSSLIRIGNLAGDGATIVAQDGGNIINQDGNGLINQDGNGIINQDGNGLINQDGNGLIPPQTGGSFVSHSEGSAARESESNQPRADSGFQDETTPTGFIQTGGETNLNGILIEGDVTLNGGVLSGSGIIAGNLINNGGYISPGHSPGVIGVAGAFTQGANGTLVMQDGGAAANQFDQLQVGGKATLGGTLNLQLINGYKPNKLDTFSPLGYSSMSGKFATISSNAAVTLAANGINASVDPAIPGPVPAASRNISTRAFVQTGDNVAIAGFIVTGAPGSTKKVIVRGIGPSLTGAGVSGALADPYLQLFQGSSLLSSNDNWKTNEAAVVASGVAPTNDLESAIVATLAPGAYTAVLSGKSNGTGVGLIEVYDLTADSPALLANISTRCSVQTGDNVLIGGFILQGDEPSEILVRAIGPSLKAAGVTDTLADPILELHDANGAVLENDDWQNTQESDIMATGVPPTNSKESAILATLPPGAYTAIVSGKDGGTGVALVEVYNIQ